VVRNPFDALESHFNFEVTSRHDESVTERKSRELRQRWARFVGKETKNWKAHAAHWQRLANTTDTLVLRYEDLMSNPSEELARVIKWAFPAGSKLRERAFSRLSCAVKSTLGLTSDGDAQSAPSGTGASGEGYRPRPRVMQQDLMSQKDVVMFVFKETSPVICEFGYTAYRGQPLPCARSHHNQEKNHLRSL